MEKKIRGVKSISDVVTNSSDEVFIVSSGVLKELSQEGYSSGCIHHYDIDKENLKNYEWDWDDIRDAFELYDYPETLDTSKITWEKFVDKIWPEIEEKVSGYIYLDIEDHYDWDAWDTDSDMARSMCIWSDSRH